MINIDDLGKPLATILERLITGYKKEQYKQLYLLPYIVRKKKISPLEKTTIDSLLTDFLTFIEGNIAQKKACGFFLKGYLHEKGIGVTQDTEAAKEYYRIALTMGYIYAASRIASLYLDEDYEETISFLEVAIAQEEVDPDAWYKRAHMLAEGEKEEKNIDKAKEYLELAIQCSHPRAIILYANILKAENAPETIETIKTLYEYAARFVDPQGIYLFALIKYESKQFDIASEWLRYSIFFEEAKAMSILASMHLLNQIQSPNYTLAQALLNQAAEEDPAAFRFLGQMYAEGLGISKNIEKAEEFYKKAIDMQDDQALYALAKLYIQSESTTPKILEAGRLLRRAFEKGVRGILPILWNPPDVFPNTPFTSDDKIIYGYHYFMVMNDIEYIQRRVIQFDDLLIKELVNDSVRDLDNLSLLFMFSTKINALRDSKKKTHCHYLMFKALYDEGNELNFTESQLLKLQLINLQGLQLNYLADTELLEVVKNILFIINSLPPKKIEAFLNFKKYSVQFLMQTLRFVIFTDQEELLEKELSNIFPIIAKQVMGATYKPSLFKSDKKFFCHINALIGHNEDSASLEKLPLRRAFTFFQQKELTFPQDNRKEAFISEPEKQKEQFNSI